MHIVDGALSNPVLIGGAVLAAGGLAVGLRQVTPENLPRVGVLSAVFFVASLIHVPLGFSSVHLILNGLLGVVLGWAAFPALFVALVLQAVFFGFGGLTVLGVNALNIAAPAVAVFYLCRWGMLPENRDWARRGAVLLLLGFAAACVFAGEELFARYQTGETGWSFWVNVVALLSFALVMLFGAFLFYRGTLSEAGMWGFFGGSLSILLTALMVAGSLALSGDEFLKAAEFVVVAHFPVMALEGVLTASTIQLIYKVKPELFHVARS
ncbi:cobalt transporter CbiM [Kiloniella sp. b19]|uniref:cobalt transporter CbiM n=1 Tax=Kiloniella sp. GXU_MW_B19 TaxID=3141326 RepID=UPI0031D60B9F